MKIKCVMRNEWIDGLTINHSPTPLHKQEHIRAMDVEEMESSSKIDLRDVLWRMFIKDACRPRVQVITGFQKKRCISLAA